MTVFPRGDLPPIQFLETSASVIEREIIETYEQITGRTLAPGDPVRLFLLSLAAVIIQLCNANDDAMKQNLLSYARGLFIDHIGALMGVQRHPPSFASTTIRFTLSAAQASGLIVPVGTQVAAGQRIFATREVLVIPVGITTGDVSADALVAGPEMNGIAVGRIKTIVNPIPFVQGAENITETSGGAPVEDDESLVERIRNAPESFSTAGAEDAYVYWTYTASPAIADVVIDVPQGGYVDVYVLLQGGVVPGPTDPILALVYDTLSPKKVRPVGDFVTIKPPEIVPFTLTLRYWIRARDLPRVGQIDDDVRAAVADYIAWQTHKIGRDIVPDELSCRTMGAGAKRVVIDSPAFQPVTAIQVAQIDPNDVVIVYEGAEDD